MKQRQKTHLVISAYIAADASTREKVSDAVLWLNDNKWRGGKSLNTPYNRDELAPALRGGRCVERCASVGHGAQIFPYGKAAKWEQEKKKQEYSKGHWCVASARSCNSLKLKRRGKKGDWTCQHETQIKCFQHINHSSWSTLKQEFSSAAFHLLDVLVEKKKTLPQLSGVHAFKLKDVIEFICK